MGAAGARDAGDASLGYSRASGWLADSRSASSCAQMMMMMLLLPTGSHFAGKLAGFC